jgi:hypothetical protein
MIVWILSTARSGGSYFASEIWRRLGGTPKGLEYFNPDNVARHPSFVADPARPVGSYLDYLFAHESEAGLLVVKMHAWQVKASCRYPDFITQLDGRKVICLRRRDVIRQGISLYIARHTGIWSSAGASRLPKGDAPAYDFDAISTEIRQTEFQNALLGRLFSVFGLDHLTVWYEDFVADPDAESARVLEYLGLQPAPGPWSRDEPFTRQSSRLNDEFRERFLADERSRFCGDGTFRGPPLFPVAADAEPPPA